MDLTALLTVIGCFIAVTAITIGLFLYLAGKIDKLSENIYRESKDFHARLCVLEEKYGQLVGK